MSEVISLDLTPFFEQPKKVFLRFITMGVLVIILQSAVGFKIVLIT
jgi:hypothetical protein